MDVDSFWIGSDSDEDFNEESGDVEDIGKAIFFPLKNEKMLLQNRKQHENEDGSICWIPCPNGRLRDILTERLRIALLTDFPVGGLNLKTWIRMYLIQQLLKQICR